VIKVTTHEEREHDHGDVELQYWREAGLEQPSVARCSQYVPLEHIKIKKYLGTLHQVDLVNVLEKIYR